MSMPKTRAIVGGMRIPRHSRLAFVALVVGCTVALAPAVASAQNEGGAGKAKGRAPRGIITLAEVTISGRIQKPIASVDVGRIRPKLTLSELEQPFVTRIEAAIYKEPF